MRNKTFNIYCDESCHLENDQHPYMFLGAISCAYNQVRLHTQQIEAIKKKHRFYAEIKWSPVSMSKFNFYSELLDYFFATDLRFRAVGIKKEQIKNNEFNQSFDDFYYKMYYQLLNYQINSMYYTYNVYLDKKDTLSAHKIRKLREILNTKYGVFRNVQNIHSKESKLMQLCDFIMGAISYSVNNIEKENLAKVRLVEKLEKKSGYELNKTNYSPKLNLFFIELK